MYLVRRRLVTIAFCSAALLLIALGVPALAYANDIYPCSLNGKFALLSKHDLEGIYTDLALSDITLVFPDGDVTISPTDFASVKTAAVEQSYLQYITMKDVEFKYTWDFDEKALHSIVDELHMINEDACIQFSNGRLSIQPEIQHREFDTDEVCKYITEQISSSDVIDVTSLCSYPSVTEESLQGKYTDIAWINNFHISYSDGTTINAQSLYDAWDGNELDYTEFTPILNALSEHYETTDGNINFTTTGGKELLLDYYTYGHRLNTEKELEFIKECIEQRQSVDNRDPALLGYDDFGDTYIEVSIADQHVWHYVDGELCCETDCVTGKEKDHMTPQGVFYVSEKIHGKYLVGDDYKTWVNRWMRLTNSGVGLHDAYWRGRFGGDIYKYNGSHGCINLPKQYAYTLYDEITTGIPVVIYNE